VHVLTVPFEALSEGLVTLEACLDNVAVPISLAFCYHLHLYLPSLVLIALARLRLQLLLTLNGGKEALRVDVRFVSATARVVRFTTS